MQMNGRQIRRIGVAAAMVITCSGQASPPAQQSSAIRSLVAREAEVEIAAWRPSLPTIAAERVTLRRLEINVSGTQLWEVRAPVDHWHRYVVAQRGNQIWRLGGFAANDLQDYYNSHRAESTPTAQDQLARYLVALTDPNGGEILFPAGLPDDHPIIRLWVSRRPSSWPADTAKVDADGASLIRLTVLSKQENSYDQPWVPTVYTFRFDAQGDLRAWHRREGAVLREVAQPVAP